MHALRKYLGSISLDKFFITLVARFIYWPKIPIQTYTSLGFSRVKGSSKKIKTCQLSDQYLNVEVVCAGTHEVLSGANVILTLLFINGSSFNPVALKAVK